MNRYLVGALVIIVSLISRGDEMIDYLRTVVREDGPVYTGKCEDVRELKYPGQRFVHEIVMTIEGSGSAVTPRCWGWFKTKKTMYLRHISNIMLIESIESTSEDLEKGIIKSRFSVQRLDEQLESATTKVEVGNFDSAEFCQWVKTCCEKVGSDDVEESNAMWLNPPVKLLNRLVLFIDKKIASDGTIVADEEFVAKHLPGYSACIGKMHDFIGTKVVATWEYGKGYTSVDFLKTGLSESDRQMIAKLIYRTNPMSVNDVLPSDKKVGDIWTIDSRVIGGAVFDLGLDFDQVDGAVRCRHRGFNYLDAEDALDEYRLLSKSPMQSIVLEIPRDDRNRMDLVTNNDRYGDVAVSFSPYGKAVIFDEHDKDGRHIYYLRDVQMDGIVKSKISRRTSLLKDVEFTGTDLKVHLSYSQARAK